MDRAVGDRAARLRRVVEACTGVPATDGNRIDLLRNGDEVFPAMLAAIERAERTVDLATFVWWGGEIADRFADALAERARAGVRVRLLVDAFGGRHLDEGTAARMTAAGVALERFRPRATVKIWEAAHRTHRRVLVCDEQVAFTGGVGIGQEWVGDGRRPGAWRDTHVRVRGPAVDGLRAAFLDNWAAVRFELLDGADRFPGHEPAGTTPALVVRGAGEVGWSDVATLVRVLLETSEERVRVSTPYLAPDDDTLRVLCATARRDVDVAVVTAGERVDKRVGQLAGEATYAELLEAGVAIWHHRPSMFHAKTLTVDRAVGCVGTVNFDSRSFGMDEEVEVVAFDPDIAAALDDDFDADVSHSDRVTVEEWQQRPLSQRAGEAAAHVFSDHL